MTIGLTIKRDKFKEFVRDCLVEVIGELSQSDKHEIFEDLIHSALIGHVKDKDQGSGDDRYSELLIGIEFKHFDAMDALVNLVDSYNDDLIERYRR